MLQFVWGGKEYNVYAYICIDYFWKNIQEVGMVAFSRGKEVAQETEETYLFTKYPFLPFELVQRICIIF